MRFDEPLVMATDYGLAAALVFMGVRLGSTKQRIIFFAAAATALIGGTRHGLRSTIPVLPLEAAWRLGLAAFGISGWALATTAVPARFHRWFSGKLALYLLALCFTGSFEFAAAGYAFDVAAAALVLRSDRWFAAGAVLMAGGAGVLFSRWSLGPLPPASLFHLISLAGFSLWFRAFRIPLTVGGPEGISRL